MRIFCDCLCLPGGELARGSFLVIVEGSLIAEVLTLDPVLEHSNLADKNQRGRGCSKLEDDLYTYLLTPGFIDLHTHGMGKPSQCTIYSLCAVVSVMLSDEVLLYCNLT